MSLVYESLGKIFVIDRTEIQNLVIRECELKVVYLHVKIKKNTRGNNYFGTYHHQYLVFADADFL